MMEKYKKKNKTCKNERCGKIFTPFNSLQKYCSWGCHNECEKPKQKKRKPINKVSKKQAIINSEYSKARKIFLSKPENQICFIEGCNAKATTVEHTRGRGQGYFDKFAEDNDIKKTLDERFWKPCCLFHNLELEKDPELSKKYQISKLHGGKK